MAQFASIARPAEGILIARWDEDPHGTLQMTGAEEPYGSDQLDPGRQIFHPGGEYGRPDCVATLSEDRVVINGRKADWISNGTIAEVCILYCAADTGLGPAG
jgi:acyl-CoA dehydrogenase